MLAMYIFYFISGFELCFSPFLGEWLFFAYPKKSHQKKGHPAVLAFGYSVRFSL